ncbi:MAG: hypothetical protein R3B41_00295 [Candidatus Doudnabacteria bacterium]
MTTGFVKKPWLSDKEHESLFGEKSAQNKSSEELTEEDISEIVSGRPESSPGKTQKLNEAELRASNIL